MNARVQKEKMEKGAEQKVIAKNDLKFERCALMRAYARYYYYYYYYFLHLLQINTCACQNTELKRIEIKYGNQ